MNKHNNEPDEALTDQQELAELDGADVEAEEAGAETAAPDEDTPEEPDYAAMIQEEQDKYLRLRAEFENFRKRTVKEKTDSYAVATAAAVEAMLPAMDSFALAMAAECADEAYKTGMEKIYAQMEASLKKLGVTEIESLGKEFDPNLHNAIKQSEDTDYAEGFVCEVFQKGYLLGDRVIRHAMVAVAS